MQVSSSMWVMRSAMKPAGTKSEGRNLVLIVLIPSWKLASSIVTTASKLSQSQVCAPIDSKLNSTDVIDTLSDLLILRGVPGHVRSDNGPEFIAKVVREWIVAVGAKTAFIEPGSPWENGYCESFNSKLRDELLNGEIFYSLAEAKVIIEAWRRYYNTERPHSSLGYKPPAPEAIIWPGQPPGSVPSSAQAMAEKPVMH